MRTIPAARSLSSIYAKLNWIDGHIASDEDRKQLAAAVQRQFSPVYAASGSRVVATPTIVRSCARS